MSTRNFRKRKAKEFSLNIPAKKARISIMKDLTKEYDIDKNKNSNSDTPI